ncbi:hypothetical protein FK531_18515 [Rhodococcus spelaei]|uniref:Uncharacterized protein n=1 Tax=Rhodococcus spelaei TaxID=2546320 RepID=A0A541B2G2_9NOCA|nr:hypothetical protein [Rhodococcus spelaei]TQF66487.1 hypothetical protein FK531_18515 [Rhodococcus spelaei]
MSCPSSTLVMWVAAWLAGSSSPDDVIDAVQAWAPMHLVGAVDAEVAVQWDLPWPDPEDAGPVLLLRALRRLATEDPEATVALVLPAPGDVRGLPLGTAFAGAAIESGQGVLVGAAGRPGLGMVPTVDGPDVLRWTVFPVPSTPLQGEQIGLGEAEFELRRTVTEAAEALTSMQGGYAADAGDPRTRIAEAMAEFSHHSYPESTPARALRIFDTADQVAAILTVAGDSGGRAQTAAGAAAREETLRPLWSAVRRARLGAVSASVRAATSPR